MKKIQKWYLAGIAVALVLNLILVPAFADKDDECRGNPHHCDSGGGGTDSLPPIDVNAEADADASATADAEASAEASAAGGSVVINNKRPASSFIGGGDSTASDQKVFAIGGGWLTGNASIRWDMTDKDARKLRIAREWKADGHDEAADKMQCSIKLVYKPFGSSDQCYEALNPPEPEPTGNVVISEDEYNDLLMAQVQQEEFDDAIEMVEYRYVQQQSLIDTLKKEHKDDDKEIKALKSVVSKALKDRDERQAAEDQKTASFAQIYSKYAEQEEEADDEG